MDIDVLLKPVSIDDAALLSEIALRAYAGHYLHLWHDGGEWYMQKSFSVQQLQSEIQNSNARFFMVHADNLPVGFVKINIDAPLGDYTNALELERIYFIKEAGNKGIGTKATQQVFNIAQRLGKQVIWLKVMDTSDVPIAFYKKHGFEICGRHRLTMQQMKEELRGMYVMQKFLMRNNV